jgi:hypothetical protein
MTTQKSNAGNYTFFSASAGPEPEPTEFGLRTNPNLKSPCFQITTKTKERNAVLNLPLENRLVQYAVKVGFGANFTRYKPAEGDAINNNIY